MAEAFGSQVLPRDLSLFEDGTLRMVPVPELATLRIMSRHHHYYRAKSSAAASMQPDKQQQQRSQPQPQAQESVACVGNVNGTQLEINFTVHRGPGGVPSSPQSQQREDNSDGTAVWASVTVLASPDGRERTLIGANATHLILDQLNSTLTPDLTPAELSDVHFFWNNAAVANRTVLHAPLPTDDSHTIRAFLDGYNLEVFADDRVAITTNLFPTLEDSVCVGVEVGAGKIGSLDIYGLSAAPITGVPV